MYENKDNTGNIIGISTRKHYLNIPSCSLPPHLSSYMLKICIAVIQISAKSSLTNLPPIMGILYATCTPNYADHRQEISFESMHGQLNYLSTTEL